MESTQLSLPMDGPVDKEGIIKKRSGRMHQWNSRYLILKGSQIMYKLKPDSQQLKGSYEMVPGCVVTDILEETKGTIKGKKLYSFWIVWPHDKHTKEIEDKATEQTIADNSDGENNHYQTNPTEQKSLIEDKSTTKTKDLKHIVESEVMTQKRQKTLVEEQLQLHQSHDTNVSIGVKVAALAVGGVVVGALTAGIGVVPYFTVVGITAVAGGGAAAFQWRKRPSDSRLIIACESFQEAKEWKEAIQFQIMRLEITRKPMLPSSVDPKIISNLLDKSTVCGEWRMSNMFEGVRIMEHVYPNFGNDVCTMDWMASIQSGSDKSFTHQCRKAQSPVACTPIDAFLILMNSNLWPKVGTFKVLKEVDDHLDLVGVEVRSEYWINPAWVDCGSMILQSSGNTNQTQRNQTGKLVNPFRLRNRVTRRLCFNRFWKMDDDGSYIIIYNSTISDEYPASCELMNGTNSKGSPRVAASVDQKNPSPTVDCVISIAPRVDVNNFEFDVPECMVTCLCQVSGDGDWQRGEEMEFMDSFLKDSILELKQMLLCQKYPLLTKHDGAGTERKDRRQKSPTRSQSKLVVPSKEAPGPSSVPITLEDSPSTKEKQIQFTNQDASVEKMSPNARGVLRKSYSLSSPHNATDRKPTSRLARHVLNSTSHSDEEDPDDHQTVNNKKRAFFSRTMTQLGGKRGGVTTVQPGVEDDSAINYHQVAVANSQLYSDGIHYDLSTTDRIIHSKATGPNATPKLETTPRSSHAVGKEQVVEVSSAEKPFKSKVSFFTRNRHPAIEHTNLTSDDVSNPTPNTLNATDNSKLSTPSSRLAMRSNPGSRSPTPTMTQSKKVSLSVTTSTAAFSDGEEPYSYAADPASASAVGKKRRNKKLNSEINATRTFIGAKEYELERLEKQIRKKVVVGSSTGTGSNALKGSHDKHHVTSEEFKALQYQQSELQKDILYSKEKYLSLTGEQYESKQPIFRSLFRSRHNPTSTSPIGMTEEYSHQHNETSMDYSHNNSSQFDFDSNPLRRPDLTGDGYEKSFSANQDAVQGTSEGSAVSKALTMLSRRRSESEAIVPSMSIFTSNSRSKIDKGNEKPKSSSSSTLKKAYRRLRHRATGKKSDKNRQEESTANVESNKSKIVTQSSSNELVDANMSRNDARYLSDSSYEITDGDESNDELVTDSDEIRDDVSIYSTVSFGKHQRNTRFDRGSDEMVYKSSNIRRQDLKLHSLPNDPMHWNSHKSKNYRYKQTWFDCQTKEIILLILLFLVCVPTSVFISSLLRL